MKFCTKCGKEIVDEAIICHHCGCSAPASVHAPDAPNMGFAILGFFSPLVGLILYLINKDTAPLKAKSAGKGALIGFVTSIVFGIIYGIIVGVAMSSLMYY